MVSLSSTHAAHPDSTPGVIDRERRRWQHVRAAATPMQQASHTDSSIDATAGRQFMVPTIMPYGIARAGKDNLLLRVGAVATDGLLLLRWGPTEANMNTFFSYIRRRRGSRNLGYQLPKLFSLVAGSFVVLQSTLALLTGILRNLLPRVNRLCLL